MEIKSGMSSLFSIGLRAGLILLKFVFIILFTKLSTVENVGVYALLVSTLTIIVFIFGAELHSSACRDVVIEKTLDKKNMIFSTHSFFVFVSCAILVFIYFITNYLEYLKPFYWLGLPVVFLCFFESYSQELSRYLLMSEKPVASNVVQLVKGGLWVAPVLYLISNSPEEEHLYLVINGWLLSTLLATCIGLLYLRKVFNFTLNVDVTWLFSALKRARVYWYVAILSQFQMYSDRFVLNYFSGAYEVGVLSVFQNFTNVIQTFVQVGVIAIFLPKLISTYHLRDLANYTKVIKKLITQSVLIIAAITLALLVCIKEVLILIDKQVYFEMIDVFYLQVLSSVLLTLSLLPHILLYSIKADDTLFKIAIISLPFYLVSLVVLVYLYGVYGVVVSAIFYNVFLILCKSAYAYKFITGTVNETKNII